MSFLQYILNQIGHLIAGFLLAMKQKKSKIGGMSKWKQGVLVHKEINLAKGNFGHIF